MKDNSKNHIIDVVIPVHSKDLDTLEYCISSIRKNIKSVRRIITISKEPYTNSCEWFPEDRFPFSLAEVGEYFPSRCGWYFQQLLKLYSVLVIPNISDNVLVVDSDTVFFRKISMFSKEGLPEYNLSKDKNVLQDPFYQKALHHIFHLLPDLKLENIPLPYRTISGISHHMLFQKKIILDLFKRVEEQSKTGEPFYKIFLKQALISGEAAEYNLYYFFILRNYFENIRLRQLRYKNTAKFILWKYRLLRKYYYCSFHSYMRESKEGK